MESYDVFISYSRSDIQVADEVCHAFDKAGIKYFIDRVGISGGATFSEELAEAIDNSTVMLFLASANSYESKWTIDEIHYAKSEKPMGSILPYIIDGTQLPKALKLALASCNQRNMAEHPIEPVLVSDVKLAIEKLNINKPYVTHQTNTVRPKSVTPIPEIFRVKGDSKPKNLSLAVIIPSGDTHYFTYEQWNLLSDFEKGYYKPYAVALVKDGGCLLIDLHDLHQNAMSWLAAVYSYKEKMPTAEQLNQYFGNPAEINQMIQLFGGTPMKTWIWSQTSVDTQKAYAIYMGGHGSGYATTTNKEFKYKVRGVKEFMIRQPMVVPANGIGRNDLCPCGSGKKYKNCHGR